MAVGNKHFFALMDAQWVLNYGKWKSEYGRLFKETKLGFLAVFDHGAKLSAYNEIEKVWCPCTKCLSGVIFRDKLENEEKPPNLQTDLTKEERDAKQNIIFDTAERECATFLTVSYTHLTLPTNREV